ncbi:MAG: sensor histidine kinase [Acetobacteraceae bacterium]
MRSLTLRLTVTTALWVAAGLGVAGWFVNDAAVRQIQAAFDARLQAALASVSAAVSETPDGHLDIARSAIAGEDFERPLSGAYWQVTGRGGVPITSRSLWDQTLPPFERGQSIRLRDVTGPRDAPLRVAARDIVLPTGGAPIRVMVALSRAGTIEEIARLRQVVALVFAVLVIGLVAGVAVQVVLGLAPLRRARRRLAEVRGGTRDRLDLEAPSEIAPLVAEIDALIVQNHATVERARTHVGNLAHALKTPIAVLRNAVEADPADIATARAEMVTLDRLIQHHLARARGMALVASTGLPEIAPLAVAQDLTTALRRLFADRDLRIEVRGSETARIRIDPQDLTEMLGNLMENACKWAQRQVTVTIADGGDHVSLLVEDDGPGLPEGGEATAMARGGRLDEMTPGSGLGLAIARDLAAMYGGTLTLDARDGGGLSVRLSLPRRGR